jgi:predicted transcriptional regulator
METQIKNILSKDLITVQETDSLQQAEDLMNNYNVRHLPVVDASRTLTGLLSRQDFSALRYVDSRLQQFKVKNFMSSPVISVGLNSKVKAVAQLFVAKKISSALIINNGEVAGIVTSEDLIKILAEAEDLSAEAEQMDLSELASEGWISSTTLL